MTRAKKWMTIVGALVCCLVLAYWLFGFYVDSKWGQHLPLLSIEVDGVEREYYLFSPTTPPDEPMPLLLLVHGGDSGGYVFPQQDSFEAIAEREGVVLAFPVAKRLPPNEGGWQLNTDAQSMQDIDFIQAVIDDVSREHSVDGALVYAIGYSLGSMFSYELACHMSSRFAAIASFAGTMPVAPNNCVPAEPVPLLHVHGFEDPIIAYGKTWDWKSWDSVGSMMDIPSLVQFWSDQHGCGQETTQTEAADSVHIVHDACDGDVRVEHVRLLESGHGWPDTINGVSTHDVLWSFLSGFSKAPTQAP